MPTRTAHRGTVLHCLHAPDPDDPWSALELIEDGVLVVEDGRISACGAWDDLAPTLPAGVEQRDHRPCFLCPGFIDTHLHYVQMDIVASYGRKLLDWLEEYTFPAERVYADADTAAAGAARFLAELWRHGTTSALVMTSAHRASTEALFEAALAADVRLVSGKTLMDRNCPEFLADTAAEGHADTLALLEAWHGRGRLGYAVAPRFAPTSTPEQLRLAGEVVAAHPEVLLHTHLAENHDEIAWARELFPERSGYLDVYDHYGLLTERSVFAHCIHLTAQERRRFAEAGATVALCPTSNLFLGSGLYDLAASDAAGMNLALGTDIGAGTSFSLLQTMAAAYNVTHTAGTALHPARAWYLATLGGAEALHMAQHVGNFAVGKEADLVVLDPQATPLLRRRVDVAADIREVLFALMVLGDDRVVKETLLRGRVAHRRDG